MNIVLTVKDKVASVPQDVYIVCGNGDYKLVFNLDDEWEIGSLITACFTFCKDGKSHCVKRRTFTNTVDIPVLANINQVFVGLYAGEEEADLRTSTPARIVCLPSATCGDAIEIGSNSSRDAAAIAQLKAEVGALGELNTTNKDSIVLAINELYQLINSYINTASASDVT